MYGAINMLAKCRCDWFNFQWWCRQFIAIVMKMMVAQKSNRRLLLFPIFGGNTGTGVGWCWRWHRCCENKINSNRAKRGEKERNENECRNYVICDTHTHTVEMETMMEIEYAHQLLTHSIECWRKISCEKLCDCCVISRRNYYFIKSHELVAFEFN